jgi:hypothetical protein
MILRVEGIVDPNPSSGSPPQFLGHHQPRCHRSPPFTEASQSWTKKDRTFGGNCSTPPEKPRIVIFFLQEDPINSLWTRESAASVVCAQYTSDSTIDVTDLLGSAPHKLAYGIFVGHQCSPGRPSSRIQPSDQALPQPSLEKETPLAHPSQNSGTPYIQR